jgi:hypothetical protein
MVDVLLTDTSTCRGCVGCEPATRHCGAAALINRERNRDVNGAELIRD